VSRLSGLRSRLVSASGFAGYGELGRRLADLEAADHEHQVLDPLLVAQLDHLEVICGQVDSRRREMDHGNTELDR